MTTRSDETEEFERMTVDDLLVGPASRVLCLDWDKIELEISQRQPHLVPLSWETRSDVEQLRARYVSRLSDEFSRRSRRDDLAEIAAIINSIEKTQVLLKKYRASRGYDIVDKEYRQTGEIFPTRKIIEILESVATCESELRECIEEEEIDRVPARKRLGLELFLLGHRALSLPLTCTTPHDRAAKEPTGPLFPFVQAVFSGLGETLPPSTLEQWCRDARREQRMRENSDGEQADARAALAAVAAESGAPDLRPWFLRNGADDRATWQRIADRDWLFLDADDG